MKLKTLITAATALSLVACQEKKSAACYQIVPLPQEITNADGEPFLLNKKTTISYAGDNEKMQRNAAFLAEFIKESTGFQPQVNSKIEDGSIVLELGLEGNPEGYQISVCKKNIVIKGASEAGVFYGIQTLRKAMPAVADGASVEFAPAEINDFPRFKYRGFHLDVSRHFSSVEFVKRTLDIMSLHNLNRFHWHLTDDQGWRVEIKKYPRLTEVGAWRESTCIKGKEENQDGIPHGGFYTQDEIREIVAYAAERNITIVPEIDLPGHMVAALTAYPELGCTGGEYKVWGRWGVSEDVLCVGKEQTLAFVEDVLSEIVELFPGEYIHIGGDECPKVNWKKCQICQAKIKSLGIKADAKHSAEEYLQSYVVKRIEKFLAQKSRRIIGWDEILEGGLAENAAVMSWRGMDGGTQAAQLGHEVIMTPNTHVYFDYYQTRDTAGEQFAIGGFIDVERVYSLEPVPAILEKEKQNFIIGAQANLWCEYLPSDNAREYMMLPRMAALSEVCWTLPEKKNYENFISRMPKLIDIYNRENFIYAKHLLQVDMQLTSNLDKHTTSVLLTTLPPAEIRYTLDGSEPTENSQLYQGEFEISASCDLKAAAFRQDGKSKTKAQKFNFGKTSLNPIKFTLPVHNNYANLSADILGDGIVGAPIFNTGKWVGFLGTDCQVEIALNEPTEISSIALDLLIDQGNYILGAEGLMVETSEDGENFKTVISKTYTETEQWNVPATVEKLTETFEPTTAKFLRVTAKSVKKLPKWHGATGEPAWIFVGEIQAN